MENRLVILVSLAVVLFAAYFYFLMKDFQRQRKYKYHPGSFLTTAFFIWWTQTIAQSAKQTDNTGSFYAEKNIYGVTLLLAGILLATLVISMASASRIAKHIPKKRPLKPSN